jgi:RHS repeat-associated protein
MRYPLDNLGNPGELVDYTYHNQLTLNSVLGNFPESYLLDTAYDPAGRIVRRRLGTPGTIVTQFSYNPWNTQGGRMARLSTTDGARLLQDLRYSYDAMSNVLTLQDYWNNNGGPQTQSFTYDALDRLTSAQAVGGLFGNFNLESYTYNAASGNLESKAGVSYTYGDANHAHAVTGLSNGNAYQYDPNGNMSLRQVGGQTYNLAYDAENRLAQVSGAATASFVYDGDGKRVLSIEGGTTTVFIGNYFEWTGTAANAVRYYYAGTTRLAMRRGSGNVTWLLGDHLGSTSVSYDGTNELHQGYKPWGETRFGGVPTGYQFTGQYRQASLGLDFFNARWYDSTLSRWISPDSIVPLAIQGTQALDRYAYINNSPVNYNDPSGHMQSCPEGDEGGSCGRGTTALDLADYYKGAKKRGSILFWSGLLGWERGVLTKGGYLEGIWKDHLTGGVTNASGIYDPVNWLVSGVSAYGLIRAGGRLLVTTTTPAIVKYTETIYRNATGTSDSMTPRPGVDDLPGGGLSFWTGIENLNPGKYVAVDPTKLNKLSAVLDNIPPGHIRVVPDTIGQLQEWAATRGTGIVHEFTEELMLAIINIGKR